MLHRKKKFPKTHGERSRHLGAVRAEVLSCPLVLSRPGPLREGNIDTTRSHSSSRAVLCCRMLPVWLLRGAVIRRHLPSTLCRTSATHSSTVTTQSSQMGQGVHENMPQKIENPFQEPPKRCILCGIPVDYKNIQLLSQFVSPHTGRIYGRHITGLCGLKQRAIAKAIKRAHIMGFMPVTYKDPSFLKDPKICDV
ncbi:small ribosomal subunit protein bS18m [Pseudophryne corroboree]|uniref:small ribosomal subunit protein bS18m n=1 Tax=Pseudophryne corroboree TaxID=495146 RepID=UPI0030816904